MKLCAYSVGAAYAFVISLYLFHINSFLNPYRKEKNKMTRQVFYSFHYDPDSVRASQVRNMGVVEGNKPASDNDWETIKKGGEKKYRPGLMDNYQVVLALLFLLGKKQQEENG